MSEDPLLHRPGLLVAAVVICSGIIAGSVLIFSWSADNGDGRGGGGGGGGGGKGGGEDDMGGGGGGDMSPLVDDTVAMETFCLGKEFVERRDVAAKRGKCGIGRYTARREWTEEQTTCFLDVSV